MDQDAAILANRARNPERSILVGPTLWKLVESDWCRQAAVYPLRRARSGEVKAGRGLSPELRQESSHLRCLPDGRNFQTFLSRGPADGGKSGTLRAASFFVRGFFSLFSIFEFSFK